MASRANELGLGLILDFHYSDTWADPGHQVKPSAWSDLPFTILSDSIHAYTKYVISKLKAQNTLPEFVQIGNEITCGMLWDDGRVCNPFDTPQQWNNLGVLIKRVIQGMDEVLSPEEDVKVIIHFADGGNNSACRWFYTNIINQQIDFDIIGLSFYPWWHGDLSKLEFNLNDLANRYEKDIMVVEIAYPWTLAWNDNTNNIVGSQDQLLDGYPATVEGQFKYLLDLMSIVKNTEEDRGIGVSYWSPEWISAPQWGSPWENVSLFDFDNEVLESIKAFEDNAGTSDGVGFSDYVLQCNPNPFLEETTIQFRLKKKEHVLLSIVNNQGVIINTLIDENIDKGDHTIKWNCREIRSGIYQIVLQTESGRAAVTASKVQ
jgi:arabinogalactan endo-1,4-beta-galactosidase